MGSGPAPRAPRLAFLFILTLTLAGCQSKSMYEWGDYQNSLYGMWIEPGDFDPADHLRVLTEQITEAESTQRAVAPGMRAHVAMLYYNAGNAQEATRYLIAEKAAFPESAVFVDGLLARIGR